MEKGSVWTSRQHALSILALIFWSIAWVYGLGALRSAPIKNAATFSSVGKRASLAQTYTETRTETRTETHRDVATKAIDQTGGDEAGEAGDQETIQKTYRQNISSRTSAQEGVPQDLSKVASEKSYDLEADMRVFAHYPRKTVLATGYTAGPESTGKDMHHPEYGITYSGVKVRRDYVSTIAADLDIFPLGTILYIPDYGYGIVADKGAKVKGEHIDLYFPTVEDVYRQWGKKTVEVIVIEKGKGEVTEAMLDALNSTVIRP